MTLFDQPTFPAARDTDPDTSVIAAQVYGASGKRMAVLEALSPQGRLMTDERIWQVAGLRCGSSVGAAAKRRLECVRMGWVERCERDGLPVYLRTDSGNPAQVWRLTAEGARVLAEADT